MSVVLGEGGTEFCAFCLAEVQEIHKRRKCLPKLHKLYTMQDSVFIDTELGFVLVWGANSLSIKLELSHSSTGSDNPKSWLGEEG